MVTNNVSTTSKAFVTSQIVLCVFFLLCTIIGTVKTFTFTEDTAVWEKVSFTLLAMGGLGLLINFLTTMYFGENKRKELAENAYDRIYTTVNQLLVKSEAEPLLTSEYVVLSQLIDILAWLSKYCDLNLDVINNRFERIRNNPPKYQVTNPNQTLYGAVQVYDHFLTSHQYPPRLADSGSGAIPPTYYTPPSE